MSEFSVSAPSVSGQLLLLTPNQRAKLKQAGLLYKPGLTHEELLRLSCLRPDALTKLAPLPANQLKSFASLGPKKLAKMANLLSPKEIGKFAVLLPEEWKNFQDLESRELKKFAVLLPEELKKFSGLKARDLKKFAVLLPEDLKKFGALDSSDSKKFAVLTTDKLKKFATLGADVSKFAVLASSQLGKFATLLPSELKKFSGLDAQEIRKFAGLRSGGLKKFAVHNASDLSKFATMTRGQLAKCATQNPAAMKKKLVQQDALKSALKNRVASAQDLKGSFKNAIEGMGTSKNAAQMQGSFKNAAQGKGSFKNAAQGKSSFKNAAKHNDHIIIDIKPDPDAKELPVRSRKRCSLWWLLLLLVIPAALLPVVWRFWPSKKKTVIRKAITRGMEMVTNSDGSISLPKIATAVAGICSLPFMYIYAQSQGIAPLTCGEGEVLETAADGTQKCVAPVIPGIPDAYWLVPAVLFGAAWWYWPWTKGDKSNDGNATKKKAMPSRRGDQTSTTTSWLSSKTKAVVLAVVTALCLGVVYFFWLPSTIECRDDQVLKPAVDGTEQCGCRDGEEEKLVDGALKCGPKSRDDHLSKPADVKPAVVKPADTDNVPKCGDGQVRDGTGKCVCPEKVDLITGKCVKWVVLPELTNTMSCPDYILKKRNDTANRSWMHGGPEYVADPDVYETMGNEKWLPYVYQFRDRERVFGKQYAPAIPVAFERELEKVLTLDNMKKVFNDFQNAEEQATHAFKHLKDKIEHHNRRHIANVCEPCKLSWDDCYNSVAYEEQKVPEIQQNILT